MIDVMRSAQFVVPGHFVRQAQSVVDGGREVLGRLGIGGGVATDLVRGTDHATSFDAPTGQPDGLNGSPVVSTRKFVVLWQA